VRFFDDIKGYEMKGILPFLCLVMIFAGINMVTISCDTPEDVKPAQGQVFRKLFGGNGSEEGNDVVALPDGGFVLVGSSTSVTIQDAVNSGGRDVYIVRTDANGNVLWQDIRGGSGDDVGNSVMLGSDGNIYVCGERTQENFSGLRDAYVLRYSVGGGFLDEHTYGDSLRDEYGTSILDIQDEGFLITSTWDTSDTSKYFIVETGNDLVALDKKSRYPAGSQGVRNLSVRSYQRENISDLEPPFVCFGSAEQQFVGGAKVMKFQSFYYRTNDDEGIAEMLYGPDDSQSFCTDVERTSDGGYMMCGYNLTGETGSEMTREMIVRLDARREMIGDFIIYEESDGNISNPGIFQTVDGGYVIVSTVDLPDPKNDEISLLKIDNLGGFQWRNTFGSDDDDVGKSIIQLDDGSFVLVGTVGFEINPSSQSKMCLMKINPNGELVAM